MACWAVLTHGGWGVGQGRVREPRGLGASKVTAGVGADGDGWRELSEGQGTGVEGQRRTGPGAELPWWPHRTSGGGELWETTRARSHCAGRSFELAALGSRTATVTLSCGSLGPAYQSPDQAQARASQIPQESQGRRLGKR